LYLNGELVVLSSALVIECVRLFVRENEGTTKENSERVNKKPVLRLEALARSDQ
jgi:hypothetical protein